MKTENESNPSNEMFSTLMALIIADALANGLAPQPKAKQDDADPMRKLAEALASRAPKADPLKELLAALREAKEADENAEDARRARLTAALDSMQKRLGIDDESKDAQPVPRPWGSEPECLKATGAPQFVGVAAVDDEGGAQCIDQRLIRHLSAGNYVFLVQRIAD
jgi:hypothetical protein